MFLAGADESASAEPADAGHASSDDDNPPAVDQSAAENAKLARALLENEWLASLDIHESCPCGEAHHKTRQHPAFRLMLERKQIIVNLLSHACKVPLARQLRAYGLVSATPKDPRRAMALGLIESVNRMVLLGHTGLSASVDVLHDRHVTAQKVTSVLHVCTRSMHAVPCGRLLLCSNSAHRFCGNSLFVTFAGERLVLRATRRTRLYVRSGAPCSPSAPEHSAPSPDTVGGCVGPASQR
jgi:hypothetical protein